MSLAETIITALNKYDPSQIQQLLDNSNNPVTLTFISVTTKNPVSVPVWTFCFENNFYIFAGKKSKKVQAKLSVLRKLEDKIVGKHTR